jgi:hypothetical protein
VTVAAAAVAAAKKLLEHRKEKNILVYIDTHAQIAHTRIHAQSGGEKNLRLTRKRESER